LFLLEGSRDGRSEHQRSREVFGSTDHHRCQSTRVTSTSTASPRADVDRWPELRTTLTPLLHRPCVLSPSCQYLENCLRWRNVAPTAPDTLGPCTEAITRIGCAPQATSHRISRLISYVVCCPRVGCYPYQHKDPFVLEESPHIYVVGNQSAYDTRLVSGPNGEKIRLVSLPSFASTGTAVLVNLNSPSMEAQSISFKVQTPMVM
jgi:hypothetical protein